MFFENDFLIVYKYELEPYKLYKEIKIYICELTEVLSTQKAWDGKS